MTDADSEFLKAISAIVPIQIEEIEHRLYYNETGSITSCSMQNHNPEGTYIIATNEQYNKYFQYRVVKEKLVLIEHDNCYRTRLRKSDKGYKIVKNHAPVLLEDTEDYPEIEHYESNN